jgi:alpha-galactosidase
MTCIAGTLALGAHAEEKPAARPALKRPDGRPADPSKKVKVFILLGQSNMVGMGDIAGGSTRLGSEISDAVVSVYEGAYNASSDYDKLTAVKTVALKSFGGVSPEPLPGGGTQVIRGQITMKVPGVYEFRPGYGGSEQNIMVIDGVEVYRKEPGQEAVSKPFAFAEGKSHAFRITFLTTDASALGWFTRTDIPGTLGTLVKEQKRYPFLLNDGGGWAARRDVYYYDARVKRGSPLSATSNGNSIGPELGFGFVMGQLLDDPVLVLKSCIGNRGLGWDLLPPGSARFEAEVTGRDGKKVKKVFAGYQDKPDSWVMDPAKGLDTPPPPFVDKNGKPIDWYAGKQYDTDIGDAKAALAELARIYPDYKGQGYEVAGFVYWQGHKDQNEVYAARYEHNLTQLIPALRKDFAAPSAKFVIATGCGNPGRESFGLQIAEAQLAIGDPKKHPEFAGTVKSVDQRDLWREPEVSPRNQGFHYNRNAETYLETGIRLGWAMADLMDATR